MQALLLLDPWLLCLYVSGSVKREGGEWATYSLVHSLFHSPNTEELGAGHSSGGRSRLSAARPPLRPSE